MSEHRIVEAEAVCMIGVLILLTVETRDYDKLYLENRGDSVLINCVA
jgi:hypothetical protein